MDTGDQYWVDEYPWLVREETRGEGFAGFHVIWHHGKDAVRRYCLVRSELGVFRELTGEEEE
jgi:hypothetical protein